MERANTANRVCFLFALVQSLLLNACTSDNRLVTVECGPSPGISLGVGFRDSFDAPLTNGLMTSHPLRPGTILQLIPITDGNSLGHLVSAHVLQVSERDFAAAHRDSAFWTLTDAPFNLRFPAGLARNADLTDNSLVSRVVRNTTVVVSDSQRVMLRNPLALLNSDEHAREVVRNGDAGSRFVVITGFLLSDRIDLVGLNYSDHPEIAVNTLKIRNLYLHYKFLCSSLDAINAKAQLSRKPIPVVFLYRPVRYSARGKIDWNDAIAIDLTKYKFEAPEQ